jgi:predicted SpoU family rRNA methylase
MRSLGCDPIEIIRLRLVASRFYIIADHDATMSESIAAFVRRWGDRIRSYSV